MGAKLQLGVTRACSALLACVTLLCAAPRADAEPSPLQASPYEYLGWGDPQPPTEVMAQTGLRSLTLAFILSHGRCNPEWDGQRPLLGGGDQSAIEAIRSAGGEVVVSFGGWSGRKLGSSCHSAAALAGAYEKVIDAYGLHAIDIDIEHTELSNAAARRRVTEALALVQQGDPGLEISITMPTGLAGPERDERSLIADAAVAALKPAVWTIMPFDFGVPVANMAQASIEAAEGLARELAAVDHITLAQAFGRSGISSMNGDSDEAGETVSLANFEAILAFAQEKHLARLSFWSVNRDRECAGADQGADECSGVAQQPYAYSDVLARFGGA